jgi:hypothetical protein
MKNDHDYRYDRLIGIKYKDSIDTKKDAVGCEMPCYVAMLDHTDQVGFDESRTFREAKPLTGMETINDLMVWGKQWAKKPQIMVVLAT